MPIVNILVQPWNPNCIFVDYTLTYYLLMDKVYNKRISHGLCWLVMFILGTENEFLAGCGDSHLESQHFGRPRRMDHLRSGVGDQPDQQGETPISTKNRKN